MSIIIVGASGYLGTHLYEALDLRGNTPIGTCFTRSDERFVHFDLKQNSIDDLGVPVSSEMVLVVASGITDTGFCRDCPSESWEINVTHTQRLIEAANARGARIVFLSSDYAVGDEGNSEPMVDYGKQKKAVEDYIEEQCRAYTIVRLGKVYSVELSEGTFLTELCRKVFLGQEQNVVVDQLFRPIFVGDAVDGLVEIVTNLMKPGIYNLLGGEQVSRAEIALLAAAHLNKGRESLRFVLRRDIGLTEFPRCIPMVTDRTQMNMTVHKAITTVCDQLLNAAQ